MIKHLLPDDLQNDPAIIFHRGPTTKH